MAILVLTEGMNPKQFEQTIEALMVPSVDHFEKELAKIRTGRAHPSMVEGLKVECYGTALTLKEIATITAPEAQLIVIQPWDQSNINAIEKALSLSDLSVSPVNDGSLIRIQIQPMSSSRRQELIKLLGKKVEETKVAVRKVRQDINTIIKDSEKARKISEDTAKRLQDALQKMTDKFVAKIDTINTKKENEIAQL
ncbi:MAG: Ribosome-recycling factor [candidate division TM6 bacterium GW2011_GWE2_41_16]|nr:MAG: Ribosome-recycling factor [candidate division TM6 bacterium GW2011_GWE2_41_16]